MQRRYDRLVTVQRKSVTQSDSGEEVETWADIAYRACAHVAPGGGGEREGRAQEVAEGLVTITLRYHAIPSASRPLGPEDRILYPVDGLAANVQAPAVNRIHDIVAVDEIGREIDLAVRTRRRADVTA